VQTIAATDKVEASSLSGQAGAILRTCAAVGETSLVQLEERLEECARRREKSSRSSVS